MATSIKAEATAPQTAVQKILARASRMASVAVGEVVFPDPELVIVHDGYVETVHDELSALGYKGLRNPERVIFVTDHEVAYTTQRAVQRGRNIRKIAKAWKIGQLYDVGRGGHGHIFPMENGMVRPGMFLFAYDMHCSNFGAVGALAIGVGAEVSSVLATGSLWTVVPETVRVELKGTLPDGAHPRDVGFLLCGGFTEKKWGVDHDNRIIEFCGDGLDRLGLSARVALCNSLTELGAANILFGSPPPGIDSSAAPDFISDSNASYAGRITLDLSIMTPQVALPGGPDRAADIGSVVGRHIDHAFIGACGSSMYEDFAEAARFIKGRRVADNVRFFVGPGTNEVARRLANDGITQLFTDAGALILPPGCGPCAGGIMAPLGPGEVSISTAATNHSGRFGAADGQCYLASPLTVAASAVAGCMTDPRKPLAH
ncbi:MAG: 3-isopropylmalate dehydratase large subunit [Burkholderiales bacterium]